MTKNNAINNRFKLKNKPMRNFNKRSNMYLINGKSKISIMENTVKLRAQNHLFEIPKINQNFHLKIRRK